MTIGKYIYGVVNSALRISIAESLSGSCLANEVYTVSYQDISAIVSDSEIADYTHLPKAVLARKLLRHQEVVEKIMSFNHTIIPLRLGTFAKDEDEVRDILKRGYKLVKNILVDIMDKIEIDVTAVWSDFKTAIREIGDEAEIRRLKEKLLTDSGKITVEDQMKVGVMIKNYLDKKKEEHAFYIRTYLSEISPDFKAHEAMNDEMIINTAFFINKDRQEDFNRKVEELNAGFKEQLNFRCVGPLPPYSFYTLDVKELKFEEVNWAKTKLDILGGFATRSEIKKAYQRQVFTFHPDKNPGKPGVEREFDEVKKAYEILNDYCLSCEQGEEREKIFFDEEKFKNNSMLVRIKE